MTPGRLASAIYSDIGILASLPGQYIGAAVSQCPDARTAATDTYNVTIDAGWVGRVLITCRRARDRRFTRWFWTSVRAERVDGEGCPD